MKSGRRRIGNHRGEVRFGGKFSADACPACEFADARALLDELNVELEENAGFNRLPELRAFDGHE